MFVTQQTFVQLGWHCNCLHNFAGSILTVFIQMCIHMSILPTPCSLHISMKYCLKIKCSYFNFRSFISICCLPFVHDRTVDIRFAKNFGTFCISPCLPGSYRLYYSCFIWPVSLVTVIIFLELFLLELIVLTYSLTELVS